MNITHKLTNELKLKSLVTRIALALLLSFTVTVAAAQAQFSWISYTDPLVPGRTINDLYVDFEGDIPIVQMLTNISPAGSIYQNEFGDGGTTGPGAGPPGASIITLVPEAAFDTFVTLGSGTSPIPGTQLLVAGGAVDIGGGAAVTFSQDLLDVTWSPAGGQTFPNPDPGGRGGFMARVTLFDTAQGSITLRLNDDNGPGEPVTFPLPVPEPASGAMLMLGLLAFLRRSA